VAESYWLHLNPTAQAASPVFIVMTPSAMQTSSPHPIILDSLPNLAGGDGDCPRRTAMQIDFLLLAIEALDLTGSEAILAVISELELHSVIGNRAMLWQIRGTNPMRQNNQQRGMSLDEAKTLVVVVCYLARRMTSLIRQLVMAYQPVIDSQHTVDPDPRLAEYFDRFRAHFRARMNLRRTEVAYGTDRKLNDLAMDLLTQLLFCTGTSGMQRLWVSLFDGEVS
jgi:hypothetical protein